MTDDERIAHYMAARERSLRFVHDIDVGWFDNEANGPNLGAAEKVKFRARALELAERLEEMANALERRAK